VTSLLWAKNISVNEPVETTSAAGMTGSTFAAGRDLHENRVLIAVYVQFDDSLHVTRRLAFAP
jgi:hypothetical protein